ncbi:MAG: proton-conducting transporter membrane subunit, partial [Pseudomonadota bacterium]
MSPEMLIFAALVTPLVTLGLIYVLGRAPDLREGATLVGAATLFFFVIQIALAVAGDPSGVATREFAVTPAIGDAKPLTFAFSAEPLGALFALVASGLWIVNSLYSIGYMRGNRERNQTRFYMCFAVALFGAMGVALSGNLFTLFVFYEVLTLSTYPLVAHKGDAAAQRGARIYLMTLLGTSIGLLLVAVVWTYFLAGSLDFVPGGLLSASAASGALSTGVASALLLLFAFGVGKAALMPFHFWLPNAMVAPT